MLIIHFHGSGEINEISDFEFALRISSFCRIVVQETIYERDYNNSARIVIDLHQ